jgi:predicted small metal-binding protein
MQMFFQHLSALRFPFLMTTYILAICPSDETPKESERILHAMKRCSGINPLSDWRCAMSMSISCKELGMDCNFVKEGETGEVVIESLMRHVHTEHTEDWFEIEEIYQAACSVIREKAA